MKLNKTELEGCYIIEPDVYSDHRGYFYEFYSELKLEKEQLDYHFVQGNESFTKEKGTLRGLHFQNSPMSQSKLVRVVQGAVYDVVVDLRPNSLTYKKWIKVELSSDNKKQLLIPRGFAHGFITITDDVIFSYMVDNYYSKECDSGIIYNDEELNIDWGCENPILSDKDENLKSIIDTTIDFGDC